MASGVLGKRITDGSTIGLTLYQCSGTNQIAELTLQVQNFHTSDVEITWGIWNDVVSGNMTNSALLLNPFWSSSNTMSSTYGGFVEKHRLLPAGEIHEVTGIVIQNLHKIVVSANIDDNGTKSGVANVVFTAWGFETNV